MKNYTVYMHILPNNKKYIGITCRKPEYRWNYGKGYINNKHFYNSIIKYRWNNTEHILIAQNVSKEVACKLEQQLIREYQTTNPNYGFNHSIGGESGSLGVKYSQEVIQKRLKNRIYGSSWAKGKHFTKEHRRKIGEAHKNKKASKETRLKISISNKGKSRKGHTWNEYTKKVKCKPVLCVEMNFYYESLMEAERQTKISHSNISNCLKGNRLTAGGYHWRFL